MIAPPSMASTPAESQPTSAQAPQLSAVRGCFFMGLIICGHVWDIVGAFVGHVLELFGYSSAGIFGDV